MSAFVILHNLPAVPDTSRRLDGFVQAPQGAGERLCERSHKEVQAARKGRRLVSLMARGLIFNGAPPQTLPKGR